MKTKSKKSNKSKEIETIVNDADVLKSYQNEFQLTQTQQIILNVKLEYPELSQKQIAKKLNLTQTYVSELVNKDNFKKAWNDTQKKVTDILLAAKVKAALKYVKHLNAKKDSDSIKVCEGILGDSLKEKKNDNKPIEVIIRYE